MKMHRETCYRKLYREQLSQPHSGRAREGAGLHSAAARETGPKLIRRPAPSTRQFVVLVAEPNDDEFAVLTWALHSEQSLFKIQRVTDGQACMAYLNGEGTYAGMPLPDLLLLDIHMPRMDGFDVMARVSADARLHHLPVVVLSSSSAPQDIQRMYKLRCSSYVTKPADFEQLRYSLLNIVQYWFSAATLPLAQPAG